MLLTSITSVPCKWGGVSGTTSIYTITCSWDSALFWETSLEGIFVLHHDGNRTADDGMTAQASQPLYIRIRAFDITRRYQTNIEWWSKFEIEKTKSKWCCETRRYFKNNGEALFLSNLSSKWKTYTTEVVKHDATSKIMVELYSFPTYVQNK